MKEYEKNVFPVIPGMPNDRQLSAPPRIDTVTTDVYLTLTTQNICRILLFLSNIKEKCMNQADVPIED